MPFGECDGAGRALCQRGGAVGDAQSVGPGIVEIAAIERLGRGFREEAVLGEALQPAAIDLARRRQRPILVIALPGAARAPVVDWPIARPRIEGEQRPVGADPGDVADAADIHDGERPRQVRGQGGMIDRHQGGALPARRHVGGPQIVHDPHAQRLRERGAVADLPGEAPLGAVRDGLAVEAHEVEGRQVHPLLARPAAHRRHVRRGHGVLGGTRRLRWLLGAEDRTNGAPHLVGIGDGQAGAEGRDALAVGFDQRHVDAVERGAAHQAEGPQGR